MEEKDIVNTTAEELSSAKPDYEKEIASIIRSNASPAQIKDKLLDYHENDIADILEKLSPAERCKLYRILDMDTISDIFEVYGEQYFRNLETNLLIEMQSKTNVVISCGGGTPMRECNVVEMKKNGRVVLLTAKPETILDRVKDSHDRPLIENNKTVPFIADLMEKRREKYEAAADIIIETDGKDELQICEELILRLRQMDNK